MNARSCGSCYKSPNNFAFFSSLCWVNKNSDNMVQTFQCESDLKVYGAEWNRKITDFCCVQCIPYNCIQSLHSCTERIDDRHCVFAAFGMGVWMEVFVCKSTFFTSSNGTRHTLRAILCQSWRTNEESEKREKYIGDWIKVSDLCTILSVKVHKNPHPHTNHLSNGRTASLIPNLLRLFLNAHTFLFCSLVQMVIRHAQFHWKIYEKCSLDVVEYG